MKYPNGYLDKIAYHYKSGNLRTMMYFVNRQIAIYGPIIPSETKYIEDRIINN